MKNCSHQQKHREETALFRSQVLGPLLCRDLKRGELRTSVKELAEIAVRPPGSQVSKKVPIPTLLRWYRAAKKGGVSSLQPASKERGYALSLSAENRAYICAVRNERPYVPAALILRTMQHQGLIAPGAVSASTINRLLRSKGLDRVTLRQATGDKKSRLRWEAEAPMALWHADVCHGPNIFADGKKCPVRVHAILDDASRRIMAIRAYSREREVEMLELFIQAARAHGIPKVLYLDNGSTYIGNALKMACSRLGIVLIHAQPYDPQARGKMERFWRTLRENVIDHLGDVSSLHDIQVRLLAFLDMHYEKTPHSSLMGKNPAQVFFAQPHAQGSRRVTEQELEQALTVRQRRRVRRDCTVQVGGIVWETTNGFLAGRMVTVARSFLDCQKNPWLEYDDKHYELCRVDPKINAHRKRPELPKRSVDAVDFDPGSAMLNALLLRKGNAP